MKILVFGPDPTKIGGVESILSIFLEGVKKEHEVWLHHLPADKRDVSSALCYIKETNQLIKKVKPDLAITVSSYYHMLAHVPLVINKIPTLHWNHGIGSTFKGRLNRLIANLTHYLTYRIMVNPYCKYVVFVSDASKEFVEKYLGFKFKNTKIIYNCSPLPPLAPNKRKYQKTIVFNGRLVPEKGTKELMSINIPRDWTLEIYGSGYEAPVIKEFCKKHKNAIFRGFVKKDELIKRLKESSVLLLPTHREFFSISILEAMSQSMWVVATDIPPIREQLADTGTLLQLKEFVSEWNKNVVPVLNLKTAKEKGKKAYQRYMDNFSKEVFSKKWRELLGSLANS